MMIAGGVMILVGFGCTVLLFTVARMLGGGALALFSLLGPITFVAGLALIGFAILSGIQHNRKAEMGPSRVAPQVYVMARFAVNEVGEMIFSNFDEDAIGGRFYVRLRFPDGHDEELECAYPVFAQAGEGMWGSAAIKGRWLGSFTLIPRPVGP